MTCRESSAADGPPGPRGVSQDNTDEDYINYLLDLGGDGGMNSRSFAAVRPELSPIVDKTKSRQKSRGPADVSEAGAVADLEDQRGSFWLLQFR